MHKKTQPSALCWKAYAETHKKFVNPSAGCRMQDTYTSPYNPQTDTRIMWLFGWCWFSNRFASTHTWRRQMPLNKKHFLLESKPSLFKRIQQFSECISLNSLCLWVRLYFEGNILAYFLTWNSLLYLHDLKLMWATQTSTLWWAIPEMADKLLYLWQYITIWYLTVSERHFSPYTHISG